MFGIFNRKETVENRDEVLPLFRDKFVAIQNAVATDDRTFLQTECTPEIYDFFMEAKADNIRNGVKNIISDIEVLNIFTVEDFYDEDLEQYFHTVRIQCNMVDYYVNKANEVLEGSTTPIYVEETWSFTRTRKSLHWVLASIEEDVIEDEAV